MKGINQSVAEHYRSNNNNNNINYHYYSKRQQNGTAQHSTAQHTTTAPYSRPQLGVGQGRGKEGGRGEAVMASKWFRIHRRQQWRTLLSASETASTSSRFRRCSCSTSLPSIALCPASEATCTPSAFACPPEALTRHHLGLSPKDIVWLWRSCVHDAHGSRAA